jgi:Arc/MetJ-type ribon-helix-helix transcriptional regulator
VVITLKEQTLRQLDSLVARRVFRSRSRAIQIALQERFEPEEGRRLADECAKLDQAFEQAMAEEGLGAHGTTGRDSDPRALIRLARASRAGIIERIVMV